MQEHYNKTEAFICTDGNKLCNFEADIPLRVKIVLLFGGEIKVWVENKNAEPQKQFILTFSHIY